MLDVSCGTKQLSIGVLIENQALSELPPSTVIVGAFGRALSGMGGRIGGRKRKRSEDLNYTMR
jgi:hypothetical protein